MNPGALDQLVEAVLYEGHILYPYRSSSPKNRRRFTFGRVYPEAYSAAQSGAEPCAMQTQCLFRAGPEGGEIEAAVRFLQPLTRDIGVLRAPAAEWPGAAEPAFDLVPVYELDGALYQSWQEAIERVVRSVLRPEMAPAVLPFSFPAARSLEPIRDRENRVTAVVLRHQPALAGELELATERIGADLHRVTLRVTNRSALAPAELDDQEAVLLRTFASTHAVLRAQRAEFLSLTDPPPDCAALAAACQNVGPWPVLVGDEAQAERDTVLSSPIILSDYPRIAAESAGTLFDGLEIDEILTLRILTLTDEEKREMRALDPQARRLLERTEVLPDDHLLKMHGVMRAPPAAGIFQSNARLETVEIAGRPVRAGARVRIHPRARADIMDLALAGKVAVVEAVEQDAEGKVHLAVVVEDDPGRDLGELRQPGHRFFYGADEVEPLGAEDSP